MAPYERVIHMHISLIFGGFSVMALTNFSAQAASVGLAAVRVIAKTHFDLKSHQKILVPSP